MNNLARIAHESLPAVVDDRRKSHRTRTIYRVARVQANEDEGLGHIRNISDDGMKVSFGIPVSINDSVRVYLTDSVSIEGQVVWHNGYECGLKFNESIDSMAMLRATAHQIRSGVVRAPRLPVELRALVRSEQGLRTARVRDISQRGMKVLHDGSFTPGLSVKVILGAGVERRGIVRWVEGEMAGVMLTEVFSVDELKSVSRLQQ